MSRRTRRPVALLASGALIATGAAALLSPGTASASSHREAPFTLSAPLLDNTDVYAFVSPDKPDSVTLIANWIPFEEPAGGPNFYPFATNAAYDINIDNDGDAIADVTYRWVFSNAKKPSPKDSFTGNGTFLYANGPVTSLDDPNLLFKQTYTLTKRVRGQATQTLLKNAPVGPSNVGKASMPDYATLRNQAVIPTEAGGHSFAGQADDPFFLDLRVFDLLYGGNLSEVGTDTLRGFNVNSVALQVPVNHLAKSPAKDNPVVGIWSTTSRLTANGGTTQVSRLGNPLVNEVVVPYQKKDQFNSSPPVDDVANGFGPAVAQSELARTGNAVYGIPAPPEPRNDLVEVFLTGICKACGPVQADLNSLSLNKNHAKIQPSEMLRLNTAVPPTKDPQRLGVLAGDLGGFPNGRRLTDDVVDIELQVVAGVLTTPNDTNKSISDNVNANDKAFGTTFPYLALPYSGSDPNPHGQTIQSSAVTTPSGGSTAPIGLALLGGGFLLFSGTVGLRRGRRRSADQTA